MDSVSSMAAVGSALQATRVASVAQISILKKAIDLEAQGAMQLLDATVQAAPNTSHLGVLVDTYA